MSLAKISETVYDGYVRRFFVFLFSMLVVFTIGCFYFPKAYAKLTLTTNPDPICQDSGSYILTLTGTNAFTTGTGGHEYSILLWPPGENPNDFNKAISFASKPPLDVNTYTQKFDIAGNLDAFGDWNYKLFLDQASTVNHDPANIIDSGKFTIYIKDACRTGIPVLEAPDSAKIGDDFHIKVHNIDPNSDYLIWFISDQEFVNGKFPSSSIIDETINGKPAKTADFVQKLTVSPGTKTLCLKHGKKNILGFGKDNCEVPLQPITITALPPTKPPSMIFSSQLGAPLQGSVPQPNAFSLPNSNNTEPAKLPPCTKWVYAFPTDNPRFGSNNNPIPTTDPDYINPDFITRRCAEFQTAIVRINTDPAALIKSIYSVVLGMAGGIALVLIIISGYKFMASQGNPEAVKAATESLTSAVVGLLFIILAFVILQIVGVDILRIPGFK